jgi:hypothetical protein
MANVKISALPSAGSLAGTEPLPIVQGGVTSKTTVQDIANLAPSAPGGSDTYIQYNDAGDFGGDARLKFNEATKVTTGQFAVDSSGVNAQTGTTYTLQSTDNGKVVTLNNGSAITVTVPSGLGVGFSVICIQIGAGQVSFTTSSTTINPSSTLKIAEQHGACSLIAYATDVFNISGNIEA